MLPARLKAAAGLALLLAVFAGGWKLRDLQAEAQEGARIAAEQKAARQLSELADQVAIRTETAISQIRVENRTIVNEVQREIQTRTVYRDCVLPADGVRLANQARAGRASQPAD